VFSVTCTQPKASVTPTLAQDEILRDNRRFCVLAAGRRWGKSGLSAFKLKRKVLSCEGTYIHVSPSEQMAVAASRLFTEVLGVEAVEQPVVNKKVAQRQLSVCTRNGSVVKFVFEAQLRSSLHLTGLIPAGIVIEEPWLFSNPQRLFGLVFEQLVVSNSWLLLAGTPPPEQWVKRLRLLARVVVSRAGFNPDDVACYTRSSVSGGNVLPSWVRQLRGTCPEAQLKAELMTEYA
jgi:hypothetical protein